MRNSLVNLETLTAKVDNLCNKVTRVVDKVHMIQEMNSNFINPYSRPISVTLVRYRIGRLGLHAINFYELEIYERTSLEDSLRCFIEESEISRSEIKKLIKEMDMENTSRIRDQAEST